MADDLFDVPPAGFVAARNAKRRELRAAGRTEEAQRVSALRKPTPAVFALNHVARHEPEVVAALLQATARLRQVQQSHGVPQQAREAMQAHREALSRLGRAAAEALESAGLRGSPAIERKVLDTAQGAALTDEAGLRAGTLDAEQPAPGFAALGAGQAAIDRVRVQAAQAASKVDAQRGAARAQREEMHAEVARVRQAVGEEQERKRREAEERRRRVEERRREIEARQARERSAREARTAAQETARLRQRAEAAEKAAARAREAAAKAEQLAREARDAADAAGRREAKLRG